MPVSIRDLSYRHMHGEHRALDEVSMEIEAGETVALVGKSGSGKSTLGYILSGIIPHMIKGSEINGEVSFGNTEDYRVGFVSQIPENQLFGYRVEDALVFGLENLGLEQEEIERRLTRVLKLFGIEAFRNRPVSALSGGQKQTVCIASVLAMEPQLLILDEPVSSLDPLGKSLIQKVLIQLKLEGQTVLLIDQNLDWPAEAVDRVIGLENGRVVFDGDKTQFFLDEKLYNRLGVTVPQMLELYHSCGKDKGAVLFTSVEAATDFFRERCPGTGAGISEPSRPANGKRDLLSPSIEIHELVKEFDGFRALDGVSASFHPGTVTAVLGQNGSGKTTMVRHLIGLYQPTSGSIHYKGQPIADRSTADLARDIAYVFQHPDQMIFEDSVWKEVTFSSRIMKRPADETRVEALLREHDLLEYKDAIPMNLSMGHKHMLTILSVLLTDPDVIILDEPTLGMDRVMKSMLQDLMARLKGMGKTLILISHEMSFVAETADEAILMKSGSILLQGTLPDIFGRDSLLHEVCIEPPQVKRLADCFGQENILTVPQFVAAFSPELPIHQAIGGDEG